MHRCLLTLTNTGPLDINGQTLEPRVDPYLIEVDDIDYDALVLMHEDGDIVLQDYKEEFVDPTVGYASLSDNGAIKGLKVLTQAEYDALPADKETNGIIYFIRG